MDDLLRAVLGSRAPESVVIGDRVLPGACPLADAGLHEGAVLSTAADAAAGADRRPRSGFELVVVAGRDAGRAFWLPGGRSTIGRQHGATIVLADPTVSREHCVVELESSGACKVSDAGSANGTAVDGAAVEGADAVTAGPGSVLEIGSFALVIRAISDADRPLSLDLRRHVGAAGTVPFNRPPRPARAAAGPKAAIAVPKEPGQPSKPHFSVASTAGPLVMSGVMIGVTGNLQYALFTLLTPVIALGSYAEARRRASQGGAQSRTEYETQLAEFARRVREAGDTERGRLRDVCTDPGEILRRAALPSVRLWERRPHHEDFLHLFGGIADLA